MDQATWTTWDDKFTFPEVIKVVGLDDARARLFLADHARVRLIDPPGGDPEDLRESPLKDAEGLWGELRRQLPWPTLGLPDRFSVEVLSDGDCWLCDITTIESAIGELRNKISRRNRQIDDLRRELSQAKKDKEYWKAVAEDHKRTLLAQEANRS